MEVGDAKSHVVEGFGDLVGAERLLRLGTCHEQVSERAAAAQLEEQKDLVLRTGGAALPAAGADDLHDVWMRRQRFHHRDLVLDELDLLGVAPVEDHALHSKLLLGAVGLPLMHPPNGRVSAFTEFFADSEGASLGAALEGQHAGAHMAPAECCTALNRRGLL